MRLRRIVAIVGVVAALVVACGGDDDSERTAADTTDPTAAALASGDLVRPGRANWATGHFQAAIYSALLEELGYTVADPADNEYPPA